MVDGGYLASWHPDPVALQLECGPWITMASSWANLQLLAMRFSGLRVAFVDRFLWTCIRPEHRPCQSQKFLLRVSWQMRGCTQNDRGRLSKLRVDLNSNSEALKLGSSSSSVRPTVRLEKNRTEYYAVIRQRSWVKLTSSASSK